MLLRVGKHNKRTVQIGDPVNIRAMPGEMPSSRVDPGFTPVVAAFRRGLKSKLATIKYVDTRDGGEHLVELPASSLSMVLSADEKPLMIGDHVVLRKRGGGVLPAVGSEGRVLAGGLSSQNMYTITFEMTQDPEDGSTLKSPVTITQNCVGRDMVSFEGEESEDEGDELVGGELSSDESSDESYVIEDTLHPSVSLVILRQRLGREIRNEIMQVLSIEELEDLAARLDEDDVKVTSLHEALQLI